MANNIAFQPMGKTVLVALTANVANAVTITADSPCSQIRLHNGTANDAYASFYQSNLTAVPAVIPVAGTPSYGMVIRGNATTVSSVPQVATSTPSLTVSLISASTGNVYITPGEGGISA